MKIDGLLLFVLLGAGMLSKLRGQAGSMPITLCCLLGAVACAWFDGFWSPVFLTAILIHVAYFRLREKRLAFALTLSAFAGIFQPTAALLCAAILGVWMSCEFGLLGGKNEKKALVVLKKEGSKR